MTFFLSGSSLPTFADCEGRWAVSNVRDIKKRWVGKGQAGVGAVFGTIAHKAVFNMLKDKRDLGFMQPWPIYSQAAVGEFILQVAKGVKFDPTTGNLDGGIVQLERVIRLAYYSLAQHYRPEHLEAEMGYSPKGDDWLQVLCHPDATDLDGIIDDHKFSSKESIFLAQAGAYLIAYFATHGKKAPGFRINWFQRVAESSIQPDLRIIEYNVEAAVDSAKYQTARVATVLKAWDSDRSEVKKNWHFNFNPNSKFCNKKTCSAWGTGFCNQWIDKPKETTEE